VKKDSQHISDEDRQSFMKEVEEALLFPLKSDRAHYHW